MAQGKQAYRLRIRTRTDDPSAPRWIIGGTLFSLARAQRRAERLREQGHVVHVDLSGRGWH